MEDPPPVPPRDTPHKSRMDVEQVASTPASGSKRKREDRNADQSETEDPCLNSHTSKRSRSNAPQEDTDVSDGATPRRRRDLRRKKGISNLSNLNLRHEAEQQRLSAPPRESKFQEGSLNDKTSEKPPSAFTRILRTESGNLEEVDQLMNEYHNGIPTPRDSAEDVVMESKTASEKPTTKESEGDRDGESSGFLRFGQRVAANFRPLALWNKIWNETKEELTQKNLESLEEAERRRRHKAEAEARYAEMKQSGLFPTKRSSYGNALSSTPYNGATPVARDASTSTYSGHLLSTEQGERNENPDTATKPSRTLKSRLHFRKPSLNNLRFDLKRARSELNVAGSANRESSSSVSPVKTDAEASALRKSHSRVDMRKQHKLSKRVSDLESKLESARRELDEALAQASPMPKLGSKYERFTPISTLKRSSFIPGKLPSLPSERLLDPSVINLSEDQMTGGAELARDRGIDAGSDSKPSDSLAVGERSVMQIDEETIRPSRARAYPTRASDLFGLDKRLDTSMRQPSSSTDELANMADINVSFATPKVVPADREHDDVSAVNATPTGKSKNLEVKLKELDDNVKMAKKQGRPKKRKSGAPDTSYKPNGEEEDEDDLKTSKAATKKRKSTGKKNSPNEKRSTRASKKNELQTKIADVTEAEVQENATEETKQEIGEEIVMADGNVGDNDDKGEDEHETAASVRTSIDSAAHSLEPLYEEEEDTSTVPINDAPSKPTAKATPARFGRVSRSVSPSKRNQPVALGAEEKIITRAAEAARDNPARRGRSNSPGKKDTYEWPEDVF